MVDQYNYHQLRERELNSKRFYDGKKEYYQQLLDHRAKVKAPDSNEIKKLNTVMTMQKQYEEQEK